MKLQERYFLLTVAFLIGLTASAYSAAGSISGEVRDAVTRQPLPGANIVVAGTALGTTADENGYFILRNIEAGVYGVSASIIGYQGVTNTDVVVHPQRNTVAMFSLTASSLEMETVEIHSDYFSRPADNAVSVRTLSPEEIRRSPGSAEDIFRVMQSMPGVATAGGKSAQLIVRGGSPDENLTLLDNIEIYNPIHFARTGESMGIISIVNPALLEKVDFLTGGFPAKYGDKMSSVFDMTLKDGNREVYNSDVNTNIAGFGVMTDGPVGTNGSMIFSLRRGFFDILTSILDRPAAPRYYDAVGKVTYDIDPSNRVSLVGFYYIDQIDREGTTKESAGMSKYEYLSRDDYGSAFGVNWRSLMTHSAVAMTTVSFTGNGWTTRQGTLADRSLRGEDIVENEYTVKSEITWQAGPSFDITAGGQFKMIGSTNKSWLPADTSRTGIITPSAIIAFHPALTNKSTLYIQSNYSFPFSLSLSAGVRYDRFELTGESTVSPRVSASYSITDRTTLHAAWGTFVQAPMGYQIAPDPRNRTLVSATAVHSIAGIEHRLADDTRAVVEVYYKDLSHLIVGTEGTYLLSNAGSGFARGIELSLQKKFSAGMVGSASYSYSESKRRDDPTQPLYAFEYDRPHIVNLIGGMELGNGWQLGAKFQFASGNPYTPVQAAVSKGGTYYLVDGPVNSARYPDYHKLDIRVDKQFSLGWWTLTAYLDLWNVYNRENIMSYAFSADDAGNVVLRPRYDFGVTPIAGITAKF